MPHNLKALTGLVWAAGFLTIASHNALAQEAQRVRGAIESLNGNTLVVKTREGTEQTVKLKPDWKVRGIRKAPWKTSSQGISLASPRCRKPMVAMVRSKC